MSIPLGQLIVLDTNVLIHLVRNNEIGQRINDEFKLTSRVERPLFSTITEGEIFGLAKSPKWKWGEKKLQRLQEILNQLVRVDAGLPEVTEAYSEAYSELYAESQATGHPTGENDLWIAATAKATGAALLTGDSDFNWMKPPLAEVVYVPFSKGN